MNRRQILKSPFYQKISLILLIAIVSITFLAYGSSYFGWQKYLELLSHFQVQYFIGTLILLGLLILLRQKNHIFLGIFFCAILSVQILPWFFPSNLALTAIDQQINLKVLIANVQAENQSYDKVINLVRKEKPNFAIFMEVDKEWQSQLDTLNDLLPHSSGHCSSCNLGILLYSKQKLDSSKVDFFGAQQNSSVIAEVTIKDKLLTIVATHPFPPPRTHFFHSRNQQMDSISQYLSKINNRIILAGDLNMSMWSPYYRRLINKTGLRNTRKGFGILPSWGIPKTYKQIPNWLAFFLRIPIDHCLVSRGFEVKNISTGAETGSDHLPLIVNLRMTSF